MDREKEEGTGQQEQGGWGSRVPRQIIVVCDITEVIKDTNLKKSYG